MFLVLCILQLKWSLVKYFLTLACLNDFLVNRLCAFTFKKFLPAHEVCLKLIKPVSCPLKTCDCIGKSYIKSTLLFSTDCSVSFPSVSRAEAGWEHPWAVGDDPHQWGLELRNRKFSFFHSLLLYDSCVDNKSKLGRNLLRFVWIKS